MDFPVHWFYLVCLKSEQKLQFEYTYKVSKALGQEQTFGLYWRFKIDLAHLHLLHDVHSQPVYLAGKAGFFCDDRWCDLKGKITSIDQSRLFERAEEFTK